MPKRFSIGEYLLIIFFAIIPLFISFPYRINIFLSWEGAYRVSLGQVPFRDFGLPMGGMFWIIPGLFFKVFGPQMISLVKAQVFLNILAGFSFRSILKSMNINIYARFLSILIFILSYSSINFWPWYNHTVIVYELIGLALVCKIFGECSKRNIYFYIIFGALFSVFSFLTKQDAGGMTFFIITSLLIYYSILEKNLIYSFLYIVAFFFFLFIYVFFTFPAGFLYWFNYGQAPHSSRISIRDFIEEFMTSSNWIKFYFLLILIISFDIVSNFKRSFLDKAAFVPFIVTMFILFEAIVFGVTSYIPPDNNIFYHSFACAYILNKLFFIYIPKEKRNLYFGMVLFLVSIWLSPSYWKYFQAVFIKNIQVASDVSNKGENVVDKNSYRLLKPDPGIPMSEWGKSSFPTLKNITLPIKTIEGIERIRSLELFNGNSQVKVLNMTELTFLAKELPFELERGSYYPLWFHLGVGMFNKQADMFENRISKNYYDAIFFENIPSLNNFYPFRIRDKINSYYLKIDSFPAPRRGETQGVIEVYLKR